MLIPAVITRVQQVDRIDNALAAELYDYTLMLARRILQTRTEADQTDAVQSAILKVLKVRPKDVRKSLLNSLRGHFRKDERRKKQLRREGQKYMGNGTQVLTIAGNWQSEQQHNHGLNLIDLLDECRTGVEREFVELVCVCDLSVYEAAQQAGMSTDEMFSFGQRVLKI